MPTTKDAFLRYLQIDKELRHSHRGLTIKMIQRKIAWELKQHVSLSCIDKDLRAMRQDPDLGFNAPIVCRHYRYQYSNTDYSILDNLKERFQ